MKIRNWRLAATLLQAGIAMPALAQQQPQALPPVTPGMMPDVAILGPQYIPASEANFLQDEDILIDVAGGNVAKAFPGLSPTVYEIGQVGASPYLTICRASSLAAVNAVL